MNNYDLDIKRLREREGEKWTQYPHDVIPAWVADMDFQIAGPIREAVERRLSRSDCGYPVAAEASGLPEIFCERVAERFNWDIAAHQVDLFNDVVQAMYFGLLALTDDGDGVVIQTPIYPPFMSSTKATKRRLVSCPLVNSARGYEIDFDHMRSQIDAKTRVLLFCNPHNPTGRSFTRNELEQIAEIALANDLTIISDEIHADLVYKPNEHIPIASLSEEVAQHTVTLMSASKAFNIAGICMAFAVFGSDRLRKKYSQVPRHLRGGVSALSIAAVTAAFSDGQHWLDETLAYLRSNRDYLATHAKENWNGVVHHPPEATYLAWFDFGAHNLSPDPYAYFLKHAKVALSDGARFGDPGYGFVRLNFATSRAILSDVLSRMDAAIQSSK
ncbi:MAG: cystathionine beta-lyase [Gammaproteobacteria bacterium]|jgi:cystathionine beta-lyase